MGEGTAPVRRMLEAQYTDVPLLLCSQDSAKAMCGKPDSCTVHRDPFLPGFIAARERYIHRSSPSSQLHHLSGEDLCRLKINNTSVFIICEEPIHTIFRPHRDEVKIFLYFRFEQTVVHTLAKIAVQGWGII